MIWKLVSIWCTRMGSSNGGATTSEQFSSHCYDVSSRAALRRNKASAARRWRTLVNDHFLMRRKDSFHETKAPAQRLCAC